MKKLTTNEFINRAIKIHGDKYDYSNSKYKECDEKIEINCKIHGLFFQTPYCHVQLSQGCPKCAGNKNYTTNEFIEKATKIHGGKYDYSNVNYINSLIDVIIICKIHGDFKQKPKNHLQGCGCFICGGKQKIDYNCFLIKARKIHGNKYKYLDYVNYQTKVKIICSEHGEFMQYPILHLNKKGCPTCGGTKKSNTLEFIKKSQKIYGEKYDYSNVNYIRNKIKVKIKCKKCNNIFLQRPNDHLSGYECPICFSAVSEPEKMFLNYLNIPDKKENRQVKILKHCVDGFDPITNIIYEFLGDYWHGNPKIYDKNNMNKKNNTYFGELYNKTVQKFKNLFLAGYKILYIWEQDWKKWNKIDKLPLKEYIGQNII